MTSIPNELTININTSVPGFQKIKFKPSMLIKDISKDDTTVRFEPLVKYDQGQINMIPENLRKKSFFNKGFFLSLINQISLKQTKLPATKEGLKEATRKGYVNNNINSFTNYHEIFSNLNCSQIIISDSNYKLSLIFIY